MFLDGGVLPANIAASSARGKAILIFTGKNHILILIHFQFVFVFGFLL